VPSALTSSRTGAEPGADVHLAQPELVARSAFWGAKAPSSKPLAAEGVHRGADALQRLVTKPGRSPMAARRFREYCRVNRANVRGPEHQRGDGERDQPEPPVDREHHHEGADQGEHRRDQIGDRSSRLDPPWRCR